MVFGIAELRAQTLQRKLAFHHHIQSVLYLHSKAHLLYRRRAAAYCGKYLKKLYGHTVGEFLIIVFEIFEIIEYVLEIIAYVAVGKEISILWQIHIDNLLHKPALKHDPNLVPTILLSRGISVVASLLQKKYVADFWIIGLAVYLQYAFAGNYIFKRHYIGIFAFYVDVVLLLGLSYHPYFDRSVLVDIMRKVYKKLCHKILSHTLKFYIYQYNIYFI